MASDRYISEEQEAAEYEVESFRRDMGPFVVAAEATRMPMIFTDAREPSNPIIFANDSFLSLTGYDREEVLGQNFGFLGQGGDQDFLAKTIAEFTGGSADGVDIACRRKDGSQFWATIFITPVHDAQGVVVQHFASVIDQTKHEQEREHLRFLLDELNHRTQNTLATVQAIAAQTLRGVAERSVYDAFEGRILALSKAHTLLGREHWNAVNLRDVLDQILEPFGLNDARVARFSVAGDEVRLQPKAALTLAMVFHELATNAAKYGALSNGDAGHVELGWQVETAQPDDRMHLQWRERGGPPVTAPTRRGFGSRLIAEGLAQDLDGDVQLQHDPAGLVCSIDMPLPQGLGR
jgi:PAS domain S-box-containing protein